MEPQRIQPKLVSTNPEAKSGGYEPGEAKTGGSMKTPSPQKLPKEAKTPTTGRKGLISLAVVLFVLLIAASGFAYWQYSKDKKEKDSLSAAKETIESELSKTKSELEGAKKEDSSTEYFQIKEWGVEFKPGADLQDLTYIIYSNAMYVTTRSLMKVAYDAKPNSPFNICSPPDGIGQIVRGKAGELYQNGAATAAYDKIPEAVKVGEYYYIYSRSQAACSTSKTAQKIQIDQGNALNIKTLKLIDPQ